MTITIPLTQEQIDHVIAEHAKEAEPAPKPKPKPTPKPTQGAVTWESFFGQPLDFSRSRSYAADTYGDGAIIPEEGVAISFYIPPNSKLKAYMGFISVGSTAINTPREGALNSEALNFEAGETQVWGTGETIRAGINFEHPKLPMQLKPGRYYFNIRNKYPKKRGNYLKLRCYVKVLDS